MAAGLSGLGIAVLEPRALSQLQVLGMKHPPEQIPPLSAVTVLN